MERDALCRGQYHGWLKEKVGSHIVRRCNIHHCEQTGIVGRMGAVFSVIEDNHIHHINNMQQAVRVSDYTAFFLLGELVEFGKTDDIFSQPRDKRTEDYITGRFG